MSLGFIKMAEGYELLAAGLREMAAEGSGTANAKETADATETAAKAEKIRQNISAQKKSQITVETVRAVLAEKSRAGKTQEVRALLIKHGAEKLSAIQDEKLPVLLQEAEAL